MALYVSVSQASIVSDDDLAHSSMSRHYQINNNLSLIGPSGTVKSESKCKHFHTRKWIWKTSLQNGSHFVSAPMCLLNKDFITVVADTHPHWSGCCLVTWSVSMHHLTCRYWDPQKRARLVLKYEWSLLWNTAKCVWQIFRLAFCCGVVLFSSTHMLE